MVEPRVGGASGDHGMWRPQIRSMEAPQGFIFYQCSLFLHMDSHYHLESFHLSLKLRLVFFSRIGLLVTNFLCFYLETSYFLIFEG